MMKLPQILSVLFAMCLVVALSQPCDLTTKESSFDDFQDLPYLGGEDIYEMLNHIQTEKELFASLNPNEYAEDMLIAAEIKSSKAFQVRRESEILMKYGLEVELYDELHSEVLVMIETIADLLNINYNPYTTNFSDIMSLIDRQISHASPEVVAEAMSLQMEVREFSDLFINRHTLLNADDEDAMLQAIIHLDKAVNWLVNHVQSKKCDYCLKIAGYVRKKACGAAGSAVCNMIAGAAGAFSVSIKKYGCGSPINLSSKLGTLCSNAVQYFTKNTKVSDRNICQNVSLPSISWKTHSNAFYQITGRTVNFGRAC